MSVPVTANSRFVSASLRASNSSRRVLLAAAIVSTALLWAAVAPAASQAAACDPPVTNPVACENTKPGADPSTWMVDGVGDASIQGYATQMSVNKGSTVDFKIKSATSNFHIDILRLGYYGGDGARLIQGNLSPTGPSTQPACQTDSTTGLVDCGNWSVTRSWTVPSTAVSGVYIAHLVRNDTGDDSQIVFVVRDDSSISSIVVQTSDATWQAYNQYGGNSLYRCTVACPPGEPALYKAAYKVSYNRPFTTADDSGPSWLFTGAEYPMIRFLEHAGYDVSYISSIDTARRPALLLNHKTFMSSGHDEYWSQVQRSNVEAARNAGVNLAFFSGNEMYWKTRLEPSMAGTADRTLVSYKDSHFPSQQDPVEWTGTWADSRFATGANKPTPANALTGQSFVVNSGTSRITIPSQYKSLRFWRNTAVASLSTGQSVQLAPQTLGYEWDEDPDNGFRPAGSFRLSSTTVSGVQVFIDYGSTVDDNGTATHNMTLYKAPSGALVFGAGTVQWSWGLDADNPAGNTPDVNMQQATVNLFADMGAQPYNSLPGVVAASKSTDTTKPTSTITNPPSTAADGQAVTLTGTASDTGGVVGGVEVSTDGGTTWHQATGTTSWTYRWVVHGTPSAVIKTRAIDDSGNIETPGAGRTVAVTCPCSIFGNAITPPVVDSGDPSPIEVGVKFTSDTYGQVTGVRFYKAAGNTGTHVGSLWGADGTRLASATFSGESASGWQSVTFSSPVLVTPGTTYVASYFAPNGHYSATSSYFYPDPAPSPSGGASPDATPLHALRTSGASSTNGVYSYGVAGFPTSSFGASNYWVDVMFSPVAAPGTPGNVTATPGGTTSANVSWDAPTTGGAPSSYTITPRINGVAQTPKTITGSPPFTTTTVSGLTRGTTYTFTVQASNPAGSGPVSAASNAVTPQNAVAPAQPAGVSAKPGTSSASLSWTAPSDGDSPITSYTITPFIGGVAQPTTQVAGSATSATVTGLTNGTAYTFTVKATNAVGTGPASSPTSAVTPQATIFDFGTPAVVDSQDTNAVELGVKFTADVNGKVTGIRFYKSAANQGTHVGALWTLTGTRLAQATFTNESASGWQTATFSTPVDVTAGTTYVASYYAPLGHYSVTSNAFTTATVNGSLRALADSTSSNGVYAYGGSSTFPANSYNASNYWVDVTFAVPVPGQPTGVSAVEAGATSATVSWTAPSTGGTPTKYTVTPKVNGVAQTPKVVNSGTATSTTVTGLLSGTTYTFTVTASNGNGAGPESAASNAVTPAQAVAPTAPTDVTARPATASARVTWTVPTGDGESAITGYTVTPFIGSTAQTPVQVGASATSATVTGLANGSTYTFKVTASNAVGTSTPSAASNAVIPRNTIFDFGTPATADSSDGSAIELGVKFTSAADGSITGVRFYKSALNTGTHVGSLWTAAGVRLAQATFTNETDSGWQTAIFSSPVNVTAGTTYVASYYAPSGHYSVTSGGLSSAVTNTPLQALSDSTSPNGLYAYVAGGGFPSNSYNGTNYWVDVMFAGAPVPNQPTNVTATAGQGSATVSWSAPAGGSTPTSYVVTPRINGVAQTAKTVTGSPLPTSTTVNGLQAGTSYTFTVAAANSAGSGPVSTPSNAVTPLSANPPGAPTGVTATADSKSAIVNWTAPANDGGSAITGYTVTPFDGATAQTPVDVAATPTSTRVTGLTNGTSYTFQVKAKNSTGTGAASASSNAATPLNSLFDLGNPAIVDAGDGGSLELGVKFVSDVAGTISGIRFYKASTNTGTHIGSLWSTDGTRLAQAAFTGESASGWQTVRFATPVAITAGTTYVASYFAPNGHYSVSGGAFGAAGVDNLPLHAIADSVSANGLYRYTGVSAFPSSSFNATNYWVDVLFAPGT